MPCKVNRITWSQISRTNKLNSTFDRRVGRLVGAWCAKRNNRNQWLQIDLRGPTRITKVATQGRDDYNQFVKSYYLYYSQNGRTFLPIKDGRRIKVCSNTNYQILHFRDFLLVCYRFLLNQSVSKSTLLRLLICDNFLLNRSSGRNWYYN